MSRRDTIQITSATSDTALFNAIANASEAALSELIDRYWKDCYGMALAYIGRAELAEEVTQDVFTKLWLAKEKLTQVESPKDYIFIVTRNLVYSTLRKSLNKEPVDLGLDMGRENYARANFHTPEEELELKEYQAQIDKAISLLPEKRREVFRLSREEGLTHAEIGMRLDIKPTTVNDHLTSALHFIRTYLAKHRNDELMAAFILTVLMKNS